MCDKIELPKSVLTKKQGKTFEKLIHDEGKRRLMVINLRYDDSCGNGHNTFSITATVYRGQVADDRLLDRGGCLHDDIRKHVAALSHFIPWPSVRTDGPLHYIADTTYYARSGELEYARGSAVWPDATLEQLMDKQALRARLPELMARFKAVVESLGFTY